ncbi:MAG TPA: helix-turn-helix domain-containing protein [Acidimicrobiales bacterium]|nr:helix-turn-helix domain-containing protein [Acidimicrobiales bacterium]
MSEQGGARLLTVAEVAALLRVSNMTVYRMISSGALVSIRIGRSHRVSSEDVDKLLMGRFHQAG